MTAAMKASVLQRRLVALQEQLDALRRDPEYVQVVKERALSQAHALMEAGGSHASRLEWEELARDVVASSDLLGAGIRLQRAIDGCTPATTELLACACVQERGAP